MLNSMFEVEEVEVKLDRAFHLASVHVAVLPVERRDRRAVAPIDTVFVVPGDLLTSSRIAGAGLFGKGAPGGEAGDLAVLRAQLGAAEVLAGGIHVVLVHFELRGGADVQLVPAVHECEVQTVIQHPLELFDVALANGHARGQPGEGRKSVLIGIEASVHVRLGRRLRCAYAGRHGQRRKKSHVHV